MTLPFLVQGVAWVANNEHDAMRRYELPREEMGEAGSDVSPMREYPSEPQAGQRLPPRQIFGDVAGRSVCTVRPFPTCIEPPQLRQGDFKLKQCVGQPGCPAGELWGYDIHRKLARAQVVHRDSHKTMTWAQCRSKL